MYADFVRELVPAYMPVRIFWVYFTGVAMMAAGISFIIRRQVQPAAFLLACMLLLFILMLHPLLLVKEPRVGIHWTRVMQDTAIMGAALGLASPKARFIARYCYALPLVVLGAQHFAHNAFVTAKVPDYFPVPHVFDYLIGTLLIVAAYGILFTANVRWTATRLGVILLLLLLLYHIPVLAANVYAAVQWTGAMLDLALAAGAFIISACTSPLHRSSGQVSA